MSATGAATAGTESSAILAQEELARLILEASTSFETDQHRARCCIQRAAELVRNKGPRELGNIRAPMSGGLAAWQVNKLRSYIESNLSERIVCADLAAHVGSSLGHFSRAFKTSFGRSPHDYVMRRRVLRAEELMATSTEPLAQIALDCGLSDQSHLSRLFRRVVGITPSRWRRAALVGPGVER